MVQRSFLQQAKDTRAALATHAQPVQYIIYMLHVCMGLVIDGGGQGGHFDLHNLFSLSPSTWPQSVSLPDSQ